MRSLFVPFLALVVLSGCYTVLRHPRVESDAHEPESVVLRNDCAACHSDWQLERYGYDFHPGWYPVYGAWPRWYYDPWWAADVAIENPQPASAGVRVEQSAGLENDRGAPGESVPAAGVWIPGGGPAGTGTVLPAGPGPGVREPQGGAEATGSTSSGRSGTPAATPARPASSASTGSGPLPAQEVGEPREAAGSPATPTTRGGSAAANPRGPHAAEEPANQPPGAEPQAAPTPPSTPPPPARRVESQTSQGRGRPNDRGEPKP